MIIQALDNKLEIASPAKINLFLELKGRREDGFHEIETVMSSISIYDRLRFSLRTDDSIRLTLSHGSVGNLPSESDSIPTDGRNLVCRSLELMRTVARNELGSNSCTTGIDVHLKKYIPSAAGLGGASGNSAAAIIAANRMWKLNWPIEKLCDIASRLGSDIPFFLFGGTAVCRGRGERVEPITSPATIPIVVAKPMESLSTAKVFGQVKPTTQHRDCELAVQSVQGGNLNQIGNHLFNRLQKFASPLTRQIGILRTEFNRLSCRGHQMSGSGSSYFGVFANTRTARQAAQRLSCRLPDVRIFCSQTLSPHRVRPT